MEEKKLTASDAMSNFMEREGYSMLRSAEKRREHQRREGLTRKQQWQEDNAVFDVDDVDDEIDESYDGASHRDG